jgi:16S rRNA G966 N2-methylase RsmD
MLGRGLRVTNQLFFGDNLDVLRDHIASASVDLIYLDPPFNSNANYNILFKSKTGDGADAQIEAFEDTRVPICSPQIPFVDPESTKRAKREDVSGTQQQLL